MAVIDQSKLVPRTGAFYPPPYDTEMDGHSSLGLSNAAGLTQFGTNLAILEPGAKSSLRHWHENQDEFVMVLEGEVTLVMDEGETRMRAFECAGFKAGVPNGHHFINKSAQQVRLLVVGTRTTNETGHYSDIDMRVDLGPDGAKFTRKDGSPYLAPKGERK